jgi:hypothetical protein
MHSTSVDFKTLAKNKCKKWKYSGNKYSLVTLAGWLAGQYLASVCVQLFDGRRIFVKLLSTVCTPSLMFARKPCNRSKQQVTYK